MARIRTIKPDFWTDEKIVDLSAFARLLFIGLWNFADDEGRMVYSPKKIKMQIFPADSLDVSELVGELRRELLVTIYDVDGIEYLQVNNFDKHQKVDKRFPSKLPVPPSSPRIPPTDAEPSRRNGMEGNGIGMEGKGHVPADAGSAKPPVPPCPHQEIIGLFVKHLPTATAPNPELWAGTRAKHLQARWRESPKRQSLEWWDKFFRYCAESEFLRGDAPPRNGSKPFTLSLDWAVDATNFAKIHEGQYHR